MAQPTTTIRVTEFEREGLQHFDSIVSPLLAQQSLANNLFRGLLLLCARQHESKEALRLLCVHSNSSRPVDHGLQAHNRGGLNHKSRTDNVSADHVLGAAICTGHWPFVLSHPFPLDALHALAEHIAAARPAPGEDFIPIPNGISGVSEDVQRMRDALVQRGAKPFTKEMPQTLYHLRKVSC